MKMNVMVIRTLLHPGTLLYFLALLDVRLWCNMNDPSTSHGCRGHFLAVVAMAAEEDTVVPSNAHQSLNNVAQQSPEDDGTQADRQQTDPNILDSDTELSKSVQEATTVSHEQQVNIVEHTSAKTSHTPTPSKCSNYMRDIISQATSRSIKPTCVEQHVDAGIEPVDLRNVTESTNVTSAGELGEDDGAGRDDHGELSGMEYGVPGTEEGTAQPVKEEEETAQDEDILTFEEFKQRRMMEVQLHQQEEIKMPDSAANGGAGRGNNYASLECGAKVIATNEEASNPKAILQENRDVYMLSPCSVDIWFIVELCDMVLVHSIEIATFELFSSVPEVFAVYTSSRYPVTEWSLIGQFSARTDSRTVQAFPLGESVYAKYIKVEMISHFGSEHYCPLSLLRVLGTSFIQEYEDSEERNGVSDVTTTAAVILDGTDHASLNSEESQEGSNHSSILVAAKDVLVNILEKVSNGLMGAGGDSTSSDNTSTHTLSLTTGSTGATGSMHSLPTDLVPAGEERQEGNSTDDVTQDMQTAASSDIVPTSTSSTSADPVSIVSDSVIATSSSEPSTITNTLITNKPITTTTAVDTTANVIADISDTTSTDNLTQQLTTSIIQQHSTNDITAVDVAGPSALDNSTDGSHDANSVKTDDDAHHNASDVNVTEGSGDSEVSTASNSSDNITLTSHVNNTDEDYDNGEEETFTDSLPTHQPPLAGAVAGQQQQKSSVLIRLSNRIKELEVNMSLFGDYLDRVRTSLQRNKNRTDDLQKCIERRLELLNETVTALRNETEMGWVLLLQLHEDIQVLTKTADDISQSLKLIQGGSLSWYHLICEAMLVVMVITGYHTYYRSQWEDHMTTMISKMMQEIERSSRRSNHVYKNQDYHDDTADHPYTRETVETHRRKKKTTGGKLRQAN